MMKKSVIDQYNDLDNKTVTRTYLQKIVSRAKKAREKRIVNKLKNLLNENTDYKFEISISQKLKKQPKRTVKKIISPKSKVKRKSKPKQKKKAETKLNIVGLGHPVIYLNELAPVHKHHPSNETPVKKDIVLQEKPPVHPNSLISEKTEKPLTVQNTVKPKKINCKFTTMADLDDMPEPEETFSLNTEIGRFLGDLEKKPVESLVVTLDAPAGSGKTRFFFQAMEDYASAGHRCAFLSLEEHPTSKVFKKKRDQYISSGNYERISIFGDIEGGYDEFKKIVEQHDIIFTDSFGKKAELITDFKLKIDKHIRKAFDGKLFFEIFQRTSNNKMRGGSDSEYDGDVILEVVKPTDNYQDNYVTARKNRYNDIPELKYSVYHQRIITEDNAEQLPATQETSSPATLVVTSF